MELGRSSKEQKQQNEETSMPWMMASFGFPFFSSLHLCFVWTRSTTLLPAANPDIEVYLVELAHVQ